ncbi:MAG: flavoprotein [Planctomycetota bacterium]|jgi:phosphopantothenoylcysteine decarboxylase/phosphopantothenate--cysteine ligase
MKARSEAPESAELDGYEVVVAVCGGISAYKVCYLVSALVQRGAGVTVAMTESATRFVGPTTFGALTGRPVLTSLWSPEGSYDPQHVSLTESLDALLVAPATYNIIGKIAHGIADDVVSTLVGAANSPVILAPAMNTRMWENPVLQANLQKLTELGYRMVPPGEGWLACRTVGAGRMAEPEEILEAVVQQVLSGKPRSAEVRSEK